MAIRGILVPRQTRPILRVKTLIERKIGATDHVRERQRRNAEQRSQN